MGVIVDEVKEVLSLSEDDIEAPSSTLKSKNSFINGVGKNGDELISIFEISSIIRENDASYSEVFMLTLDEVNSKYFDVLKEIGNIGAGNATTAIANMLGLRIDMSVPEVAFLPVEELGSAIGAEEEIIVGILLGVEEDIDGSMMFLMDMASAHHIVNKLMMRDDSYNEPFDEMD
jgi:chemotaxis protein CheY-P-specific phosphatase CheC